MSLQSLTSFLLTQVKCDLFYHVRSLAANFFSDVCVSIYLVLNAWAVRGEPKGAARAETILKKMIALHASGEFDVQPNVHSFTNGMFFLNLNQVSPTCFVYANLCFIVISAWGKSGELGCANRAEQVFELMEEEYKKGNVRDKPNDFTYVALVSSYSSHVFCHFDISYLLNNFLLFSS